MRHRLVAASLAALGLLAQSASAREIEGVEFPEELNIAGHVVKLIGVGIRTKWFFNVYAMGAYQKTPQKNAGHIIRTNEAKFLWLKMLRTISGDKMRDAVDEGVEKNVPEAERTALKPSLDTFKGYFPEKLKKGIDIGFTYLPGQGTLVRIAGADKGTIAGKGFMRALWSLWFGRKPNDKSLKKSILKE